MNRRTVFIVLSLWFTVTACEDPLGPSAYGPDDTSLPVVRTASAIAQLEQNTMRHGGELETYELSFWAVKGKRTRVKINYVDTGEPFLLFDVPAFALRRRPNGSRISWGDSVLIQLTVDPEQMLVHLEPTGLRFRSWIRPRLRMWYGNANPDLDGDGDVDEDDAAIEAERLRVWYQETTGDPWYGWSAQHSLSEKWFEAYLLHFSNYAVSW